MIALWHIDSNTSQLKSEGSGTAEGQIFTSKCSMISTGTERLIASGLVDNEYLEHMKVPFQSGDFDLPIKYGYSLVVEDENGKLGHIMHPHQDKIEAKSTDIFWINDDMPASRLALISNMETVLNAIWDSNPDKNDKIGICGFGNIGSLLANTLREHCGIEATIIEKDQWRMQKANDLGWKGYSDETFDIIYHTSSTEKGLQFCIDRLNFEGKLIELSWYGNKNLAIHLGKNFHYNRLKVISSQVSNIPGHMSDKHDYRSRKELALSILKNDSFDKLITHRIPFKEAPEFFGRLRKGEIESGLIYVLEY